MPVFTAPAHDPEPVHPRLREFNTCHNPAGPGGGRFCSDPTTPAGRPPSKYTRPKVIQVTDIEEAIRLIEQGHTVELPDTRSVNTLIGRMAEIAQAMAAQGKDAPNYDLCKVSVKNTNLFCVEKVRTKTHPEGVPRIHMPQFEGEPIPGTPAAKLPLDKNGRVDGSAAFIAHLKKLGIPVTLGEESAAKLKATQSELVGTKVAEMMTRHGFDPHRGRIFTSRDHYVIDGHHRWAAVVGLDAADNALGSIKMQTVKVDAPIAEILHIANDWAKAFGIRSKMAHATKEVAILLEQYAF